MPKNDNDINVNVNKINREIPNYDSKLISIPKGSVISIPKKEAKEFYGIRIVSYNREYLFGIKSSSDKNINININMDTIYNEILIPLLFGLVEKISVEEINKIYKNIDEDDEKETIGYILLKSQSNENFFSIYDKSEIEVKFKNKKSEEIILSGITMDSILKSNNVDKETIGIVLSKLIHKAYNNKEIE